MTFYISRSLLAMSSLNIWTKFWSISFVLQMLRYAWKVRNLQWFENILWKLHSYTELSNWGTNVLRVWPVLFNIVIHQNSNLMQWKPIFFHWKVFQDQVSNGSKAARNCSPIRDWVPGRMGGDVSQGRSNRLGTWWFVI